MHAGRDPELDPKASAREQRSRLGPGRASRHAPGVFGADAAIVEALIACAPHAIAVTEGASHVLRRVNPAFCRLLRAEAKTLLDRPCAEVLAGSVVDEALSVLERVFRSGAAERDQQVRRVPARSSGEAWSYTVWPLQNRSGKRVGLVIEVRDRTPEANATRRLQEMADQVRQINERLLGSALREHELAEKAEAVSKAKANFLAMMSHELRTPLSGIVGYAEVMLGEMLGPLTERQRDGLERINACSEHLLKMIDDVLAYARLEANGVQVRTARVDLCQLARETAAMIEPLIARKGLDFRVDVPDVPLPLETDAHKIRQILLNLLGNALKFTEEGVVRLEVREEPGELVLRIRDSGMGIPPDDLERVFEPFVQSEAVMTRRFGGTGLGLPISRATAALLGGVLTVESELGEGSTFTLRLPRAAAPGPSSP